MARKDYQELRETMEAMFNINENLYPEMEPIVGWLDVFTTKMRQACADAMKEFPEGQKGPGEAFMIGLARFNCMVLEKFQRSGFVTEGNNAYDMFYEVLMPIAHEMVLREMSEDDGEETEESNDKAAEVAEDLMNPDLSIDDIIAKYFSDDMPEEERQKLKEELEGVRKMAMKNKQAE